MASEMPVTPNMIAAGWAIVNDGRKWPPRIGSGPGLVEVYRAMRALEPATTHQRTLEALREVGRELDALYDTAADMQAELRNVDRIANRLPDIADKGSSIIAGLFAALARIKEATDAEC